MSQKGPEKEPILKKAEEEEKPTPTKIPPKLPVKDQAPLIQNRERVPPRVQVSRDRMMGPLDGAAPIARCEVGRGPSPMLESGTSPRLREQLTRQPSHNKASYLRLIDSNGRETF